MDRETWGSLFARLRAASGLNLSMVEGEFFLLLSRMSRPLPPALLAFLELSTWVGSSLRSGVWTYYEVADPLKVAATRSQLRSAMDPALARIYASGVHDYQGRPLGDYPDAWIEGASAIDDWIRAHETDLYEALRGLLLDHEAFFLSNT